jgi:hypothetical protein
MDHGGLFGILFPLIFLGLPIAIGVAGWLRCRREPKTARRAVEGKTILLSSIVYAIAFNVTFFIQELFLVVPKALTPGLKPTLYHNNHNWEGSHPLESLFQGTGALAILISGLIFAWLAKRGAGKTQAARLFVLWMAYNGLFQSLPQFATACANPGSDTGQALDWFGLSASGETVVAVIGMAAIIAAGLFMTARFLEVGPMMESGRERSWFAFLMTVLPAAIAIPVLILFRIPREWVEVVVPTIAVPLIGLIWVQANAWRVQVTPKLVSGSAQLAAPLAALLALLAVFQLVLRPGIAFY